MLYRSRYANPKHLAVEKGRSGCQPTFWVRGRIYIGIGQERISMLEYVCVSA